MSRIPAELISIWRRPRATIQGIVDTNPEYLTLALVLIAGIGEVLDRASMRNMGDRMSLTMIFVLALVIGPLSGLITWHIGAALVRWTGTWLGGKAPVEHVRAAIAWSSVPLVCSMVLWLPELALFGRELFTTETPRIEASLPLSLGFLGFFLVEVTLAVWSIVLLAKCIGQVQQFSAWRALGSVALAALVVIVPVLLILVLIAALTR